MARARLIHSPQMRPKHIYLLLCFVGAIVPYGEFLPWVAEHGLRPGLILQELFASRIGAFFGTDVILSAATLMVFTRVESAREGIRQRFIVVVAVVTVGVSLALPLFLYMRERKREQPPAAA